MNAALVTIGNALADVVLAVVLAIALLMLAHDLGWRRPK